MAFQLWELLALGCPTLKLAGINLSANISLCALWLGESALIQVEVSSNHPLHPLVPLPGNHLYQACIYMHLHFTAVSPIFIFLFHQLFSVF